MILGEHAIAFGWATAAELKQIDAMALKVDGILSKFLDERGVMLVDFKLEFGRYHGEVLLGDEICPDTCRFWDKATRQKLDKDRFRHDSAAWRKPITRCSAGWKADGGAQLVPRPDGTFANPMLASKLDVQAHSFLCVILSAAKNPNRFLSLQGRGRGEGPCAARIFPRAIQDSASLFLARPPVVILSAAKNPGSFSSPCKGEDEVRVLIQRAFFCARFKILPLLIMRSPVTQRSRGEDLSCK